VIATSARPTFGAKDVSLALAAAVVAQLALLLVFSLPSPKLVEADISNANAQPIAVSITPVLKLGSKNPTHVPAAWRRKQAVVTPPHGAVPSPQAEKTVDAIPKTTITDAGAAHPDASEVRMAETPVPATSASSPLATASALPIEGSEKGAPTGTETDPLKARAADMYRAQLQAWFGAQFDIRGKVPFDRLRTLHALVSVSVSEDRKVVGFALQKSSGDDVFDAQVRATLSRIQTGGAELPAPPAMYPEMLRSSLPVGFSCTIASRCQ
jgi:hypothetical protein